AGGVDELAALDVGHDELAHRLHQGRRNGLPAVVLGVLDEQHVAHRSLSGWGWNQPSTGTTKEPRRDRQGESVLAGPVIRRRWAIGPRRRHQVSKQPVRLLLGTGGEVERTRRPRPGAV